MKKAQISHFKKNISRPRAAIKQSMEEGLIVAGVLTVLRRGVGQSIIIISIIIITIIIIIS